MKLIGCGKIFISQYLNNPTADLLEAVVKGKVKLDIGSLAVSSISIFELQAKAGSSVSQPNVILNAN
ncbi:MAG: hypothetical protein QXI39_01170 [Candidatus Bathyarchaeia archaeon]